MLQLKKIVRSGYSPVPGNMAYSWSNVCGHTVEENRSLLEEDFRKKIGPKGNPEEWVIVVLAGWNERRTEVQGKVYIDTSYCFVRAEEAGD